MPLEDRGPTSRSGTRVRFLPDPSCLAVTRVDRARLEERLTTLGYLHPHLCIHLDGRELPGRGGLARWVEVLAGALDDGVVLTGEAMRDDAIARVALGWANGPGEVRTFVSAQATVAGGTHERGLRTGLRAAITSLLPDVTREALARATEGLVAIVDVSLDHPKFGAPTRDRLDSPIGRTVARAATLAAFAHLPPDLRTRVSALLARRTGPRS